MKNFVKYTFAFAICAVALLSSCIKEESYEVHELMLDANITRATTSSEQGDQINDVMIWAFDANDGYKKVGWVEYTAPANTYKDITVHVPVKICGDSGSTYRLVAVINKDKFKNTVTFDSNTTYQELIAASFDNSELLAENLVETNNPGNPAVMPISHWCDVPVTEADFGQHKHVEMKVFRSVAKTHFYITKKSEFDMNVTTLELHNGCLPTGGMVLSDSTPTALESESATPSWFSPNGKIPATVSATTLVDNLITSPVAVVEGMVDETDNRDGANLDLTKYQLVGSKLIYETNKTATVTTDYGSVTETSGYYYKIGYKVDGSDIEYIRFFALPQIARNHDYQVRARVDAGGQMDLTILVNEWTEDEDQVIDYQNSVTVETGDMLKWTSYTSYSNTTNVVPVVDGNINFEGLNNGAAQCTFRLRTPVDGEWYAELVTISGDPDHFIFEKAEVTHTVEGASQTTTINGSNSTVISGDISDGLITLYIKTAKGNSATQNNATEDAVVELQISAKKTWGGRERTYKVYGLTGLDNNANYTLTHLLGN